MEIDELLEFDSDKSIKELSKLSKKTDELFMEEKLRLISYYIEHGYLLIFGRILGNYYGDGQPLDFSDDNAGLNIKVKIKVTPKIFQQISTLRHSSSKIILVGLIFYLGHRKNNSRLYKSKFLWIN